MSQHNQTPPGAALFFGSAKSLTGKARRWVWISLALTMVYIVVTNRSSGSTLMVMAVVVLGSGLAIDWFMKRALRPGEPLVVITDDAIEAPNFTGKHKRYAWKDIAEVSVETREGHPCLVFKLDDSLGLKDRRGFFSGVNENRPSLPLGTFDDETRNRLLAEVDIRRASARPGFRVEASLSEDNARITSFHEQLKALAPIPWALWAVVTLNVLIWLITLAQGGTVMANPADKLLLWGGNAASEVQRGEWWRLLSATFLHGSALHLAMNMIGLVGAGVLVERIYGRTLFLLVYLGSGLVGSAFSLHFSAQHSVSVGASGAVFGVTGALLVAILQHRSTLPKAFGKDAISGLSIFIVYALVQGFARQNIDNAAHIGGLVGGALLAFVLPERFDLAHFKQTFRTRSVLGAILIATATASLAALAPPAELDQRRLIESHPIMLRGTAAFDAAVKLVQKDAEDVKSGRMTPLEADERSRKVHAPAVRHALADMSQSYLRPNDPRVPMIADMNRLAELIAEGLEMPSGSIDEAGKPLPADPQRMAAIQAEMKVVGERLKQHTARLNALRKP